jgi:hypothetical protein
MLARGNRLTVTELRKYLKSTIKEFVEKPNKVRVKTTVSQNSVIYHVDVHADDLPLVEKPKFLYRSLNQIMNKATKANIGKGGALDDQFGVTG